MVTVIVNIEAYSFNIYLYQFLSENFFVPNVVTITVEYECLPAKFGTGEDSTCVYRSKIHFVLFLLIFFFCLIFPFFKINCQTKPFCVSSAKAESDHRPSNRSEICHCQLTIQHEII